VSTVNMPGFTAENSVYRMSGHYRISQTGIVSAAQVVPQLPWWGKLLCAAACRSCYLTPNVPACAACYKCL
jgi:hypothetical protein